MSIDWSVLPLDPANPELVEWLQHENIAVPDLRGRYPTLDELVNVLATFGDMPVQFERLNEQLWNVVLGELYSATYAHMLGTVNGDGLFDFHFLGSDCRETAMLEVLKRLSSSCGPLILYEPVAGTPVLVTSTIEVDGALKEWQQRIQKNYDKAPHPSGAQQDQIA
jgi:hypothetical protein